MNQNKIGKIIKEIRCNNNLTQNDFANKYGVTYQAVSKWENGKNIPDISIIKQISKDYSINIDDLLDGKNVKNSKINKYSILIIAALIIIVLLLIIIIFFHKEKFEFKTLSASCENFTISGSIAYNKDKSSIYISNVKYCGGDDNNKYDNIKCTLYDTHNDITTKISEYDYSKSEGITLEEYLHNVEFAIDNYDANCKSYTSNSLYMEILASKDSKTITYKIPLSLTSCNS